MDIERSSTGTHPAGLAASRNMRAKFFKEVAEAGLLPGPGRQDLVTVAELAALPAPAQRYLRFMGVVGRPRDWSFRMRWTGSFRMAPDKPWLPCEAWQYNTRLGIARIFHMRLRFGGLVPLLVRDTYLHGQGRMRARLLDRIGVVDETGFKLDTGELVTYLNDAIMLAPSMVLGPEAVWSPVSESSFDVALTDAGRTVTARVFVDDRGAVTDFSTIDRYGNDPAGPKEMVQARWSTPMQGWTTTGLRARHIPSGGKAVWHFPSGDFAYADFSADGSELVFNVAPDQVALDGRSRG